jgi:hypothetical protein
MNQYGLRAPRWHPSATKRDKRNKKNRANAARGWAIYRETLATLRTSEGSQAVLRARRNAE